MKNSLYRPTVSHLTYINGYLYHRLPIYPCDANPKQYCGRQIQRDTKHNTTIREPDYDRFSSPWR